jgi:hypothetical protein
MNSLRKLTNRAFPLFSYGERHIDEFLDQYSFDQEGVRRRWEMFHQLSENILEFLGVEFPTLGERGRSICWKLQLSQIRAKITRIDKMRVTARLLWSVPSARESLTLFIRRAIRAIGSACGTQVLPLKSSYIISVLADAEAITCLQSGLRQVII